MAMIILGIGTIIRGAYAIYTDNNGIVTFNKMTCLNVNGLQSSSIIGLKPLIIAISIDRCLAVFQPVRYAKDDSKTFAHCFVAFSFICVVVMAIVIRIGIDDKPITVCSIGAANTAVYALINQIYSGIFIGLLFGEFYEHFNVGNFDKKPRGSDKQPSVSIKRFYCLYQIDFFSCNL